MSRVYGLRPLEGWKPGDRAYCIHGSRDTRPTIEVGKVYNVTEVIPVDMYVDDGLVLAGVEMPTGLHGLYSSRFVRLPKQGSCSEPLRNEVVHSWHELAAKGLISNETPA